MTKSPLPAFRCVSAGFYLLGSWRDELCSPGAPDSGGAAFIFPTIHRRREAEEHFLTLDRQVPVRLFTPRQFAETVRPPSWVLASPAGGDLVLEALVKELAESPGGEFSEAPQMASLLAHPGSRRLLVRFFSELAVAGVTEVKLLRERLKPIRPEDRLWAELFGRFAEALEARKVIFAPALESRLARWLRETPGDPPVRALRIEAGLETAPPLLDIYEALAARGADVRLELVSGNGEHPCWHPAEHLVKELRRRDWTELPPAGPPPPEDRLRLLDPLDRSKVSASGVHVHGEEADPADEIHAACERIRRKLVSGELKPQEAALVLADPYSWSDLAGEIAASYGLPVESARARTVIETEAGRAARSLLETVTGGAEPEALTRFLASPVVLWRLAAEPERAEGKFPQFVGVRELRRLERAFDVSKAEGPARLWMPRLLQLIEARKALAGPGGEAGGENGEDGGDGDDEDRKQGRRGADALDTAGAILMQVLGWKLDGAERLRQGLLGVEPDHVCSAREFSVWIERAVWNAWIPRRLTFAANSGPVEPVRRALAGLTRLFDALGSMVAEAETLGAANRTVREWAGLYETLLREAPVPERVPSAKSVRILSPRDVPGLHLKHAEWTGLAEDRFPLRRPDPVWGSREAHMALGLDAGPGDSALAWARLGLSVLTTQGEVHLSGPQRIAGDAAVLSSPVWILHEKLGRKKEPATVHRAALIRQGTLWLAGFSPEMPVAPGGLRALFSGPETSGDRFAGLAARILAAEPGLDLAAAAAGPLSGDISAGFAAELAEMITARPLSASRFRDYAKCPYRYLGSTRFGVLEPEDRFSGPTPKERGTLVHRVLELFYRDAEVLEARRKPDWLKTAGAKLDGCFRQAAEDFDRVFHGDAWEIEKIRTRTVLDRWLAYEDSVRELSEPVAVEFGFGREGEPEFRWAGFLTSGSIDRVDRAAGGGFFVFDYKTGKAGRDAEALRKGLGFQLPLYAAAAAALIGDLSGQEWRGGGYCALRLPEPGLHEDILMIAGDREQFGIGTGKHKKTMDLAGDLGGLAGLYENRAKEIGGLVKNGRFPTTPLSKTEAQCEWCHLQQACGHRAELTAVRNADRPRHGVLSEWTNPAAKRKGEGDA